MDDALGGCFIFLVVGALIALAATIYGTAVALVVGPLLPLALAAGWFYQLFTGVEVLFRDDPGRTDPRVIPDLVSPDDMVAGVHPTRGKVGGPGDRAWPSYLPVQYAIDMGAVARSGWVLPRKWFTLLFKTAAANGPWSWLYIVPALAVNLAFALGIASAVAVMVIATLPCYAALFAARLAALYVSNAVEWLRLRRTKALAQCNEAGCWHATVVPTFVCAGCGEKHTDVRGGRRGVIVRRCACGAEVRASVGGAAKTLAALCPCCGNQLEDRAGLIRGVAIAVIGPTQVGKTDLLLRAIAQVSAGIVASGGQVTALNEVGLAYLDGRPVLHTNPITPLQLRISPRGRRPTTLQVFDGDGQRFATMEEFHEQNYLPRMNAIIVVLDGSRLMGLDRNLGDTPSPMAVDGAVDFEEYTLRLRTVGVETDDVPVAVVISRIDEVLAAGKITSDILRNPAALRGWLFDRRLDNLVEAAEADYRSVSFFASGIDVEACSDAPGRALTWVLGALRIGAPAMVPTVLAQPEGANV